MISNLRFVVLALLLGACASTSQTANVVKSSVQLANDACVIVHALDPNGKTDNQVCVKESELAPLVPLIVAGRMRSASDAGADASK